MTQLEIKDEIKVRKLVIKKLDSAISSLDKDIEAGGGKWSDKKYGSESFGEQQKKDVVAFANAMRASEQDWHFDQETKERQTKSFSFTDKANNASGEVVITTSGYQTFVYVDGKRLGLRDNNQVVANWFTDAGTVVKAIDKAVNTRVANRQKNKARREAAEEKRIQKFYI